MPARDDDADTAAENNAAEISRLRRRKALTLSLFYGSIAFMPLSCFSCCGLAAVIRHETTQAVFGIAAFLAPFVGLVGVILMWSDRGRYDRSVDLALWADEWDLSFTEQPGRDELGLVKSFQVFREPTHEYARNGMAGSYEDNAVVIMDYSCSWGTGRFAHIIAQTVIVLDGALPRVPDLILCPKSLFEKLTEAVGLGGRPIRVPDANKFNKTYGLYAEEADKVAARFTSDLTALCVQERNLLLEVTDGNLLVYWTETDIKPADLQDRLATALEVVKLLQRKK